LKEYDSISNRIVVLFKKKNIDHKITKQLSDKKDNLLKDLSENNQFALSGIYYSKYDIDKVKSVNQLKAFIDSSIIMFNGYKNCFNNVNSSDSCIPTDLFYCKSNGFDMQGLYQEKTSDFKTINREYIDILDTEPYTTKLNDLMCHFQGELSGYYDQQYLIVEDAPLINSRGLGLYDGSEFNKYCINDNWITEHNSSIDKLKERYPDFSSKLYSYDVDLIKTRCQTQLDIRCRNTYIVKSEVILSYPTIGCTVRDVTKTDVENDAKYMNTNAEKLNHLTMTDIIDYCQMASDNGYSWWYQKPPLGDNCASNKPKKKSKKK
jgi:hypothetical protein